jgi:hypothetical protein
MSPYKLQTYIRTTCYIKTNGKTYLKTYGIANCVFWDILLLTKLSSLLRLVKVDIFSLLRFSTQEVKNLLKVFAISVELSTFRSFSCMLNSLYHTGNTPTTQSHYFINRLGVGIIIIHNQMCLEVTFYL